MPDLSPEAQKFREALAQYSLFEEAGDDDYYYEIREKVLLEIFSEHTSEMRARIEELDNAHKSALADWGRIVRLFHRERDRADRRLKQRDVARERIKDLEGGVAHWRSCHSVTAQQLAIANSTISDLKVLCLTDEMVDASAERLRLGLQVGRLRKALEKILALVDAAPEWSHRGYAKFAALAREALSPAEQEPPRPDLCEARINWGTDGYVTGWGKCSNPKPCPVHGAEPRDRAHVCGLSGYNGMIDPPCPGCQDRHGVHGAEGRE